MFRRTLLGMVAVLSLLVVGSGSAFASHRWSGGGGHHHHHHGGYGYSGGYGGGYGGYGYRPMVMAPRMVVAPRQVIMPQSYGYGAPAYGMGGCNSGYSGASNGYGGYPSVGYGSPYGSSFGYSSPGFGLYIGR